jgi:hypothetical protein
LRMDGRGQQRSTGKTGQGCGKHKTRTLHRRYSHLLDVWRDTQRAVHASEYMGKIDANGKRRRGNRALTTLRRSLPAVSVYFG